MHREQEQLRADRRAENRKLKNEFEVEIYELKAHNEELQQQMQRYNNEANQQWANLDVDEVIAKVRAQESKLHVDELERLETQIAELKKQEAEKKRKEVWKSAAKTAGQVFLGLVRVVLPIATMFTLGMPISLPGGFGL